MSKLSQQLRDHRRRADVSPDEVAFLFGHGKKATPHDRIIHEPALRTLIAYEVVFRASLKELFTDFYEKVERDTIKRASKLLHRLPMDSTSEEKYRTLLAVVDPPNDELRFEPIARA